MLLVAKLRGKTFEYDTENTKFLVEQRVGRKPYTLVAMKPTLERALSKLHRTIHSGATKARLSRVDNGTIKSLMTI